MVRQVPTLTEVLEEAALSSKFDFRAVPSQSLELDAMAVGTADEQLRQAIMAVVDAAIDEFRAELFARLEPLLGRASAPRSD
jgi:hypothetical protein